MVPCGGGNYFKSLVILLARTAKMLITSIFVVGMEDTAVATAEGMVEAMEEAMEEEAGKVKKSTFVIRLNYEISSLR